MIPTSDSLLKYNNPMLIKNSETKSPKQPSDFQPATPPSKSKPATSEDNKETKEVLEAIFPPREWMDGNQLWVQKVSTAPSTRADVIQLKEKLDTKLQQRQARLTGICHIRRQLYSQCFGKDLLGMQSIYPPSYTSNEKFTLLHQVVNTYVKVLHKN
ncbi:axonemal dynein light intermediate polypeptide 1-like [Cyprinodon tularosa]|uniref:axonemal dynein light intermediate polypeptide 1-like n=1 Tax=Cyprinodon tularosa TaxID=77115 RepID=UPI0018E25005|nr:axonemal dynein light intermediate polypeptide 1-like [Cyprinodon tularosa]